MVWGIPVSASISLTATHQYLSSNVTTIAMLVLSSAVEERSDYRLSSILTPPSLKCLCHHLTILLSSVAFPQTSFNKTWMMGTVLPHKVSVLMYAHCLVFVTWAKKIFCFIFRQPWHREISMKQLQKLHVLFVTVQTTHCWPTKPDSNLKKKEKRRVFCGPRALKNEPKTKVISKKFVKYGCQPLLEKVIEILHFELHRIFPSKEHFMPPFNRLHR